MLKVNSNLELENGAKIYLKENWHEMVEQLLAVKEFPYEFSLCQVVKTEPIKEKVYIFESAGGKKKRKIALSCNVVKYLRATEVPDANMGFSFKEYLPNEGTSILITANKNMSDVQPAIFGICLEELTIEDIGKIVYLDFRVNYLNGDAFTSLSYYTRFNRATWKFLFSQDISYMTDYERMLQDTFLHRQYIMKACKKMSEYLKSEGSVVHSEAIMRRAELHDLSKVTCDDEMRALSMIINDKSSLKDANVQLSDFKKDSIRLHHKHNSHHPEFHKSILDMTKLDIMEMCCDWYARSLQYGTDFLDFVKKSQANRFHFPDWMFAEIWHYCEVLAK